MSAFDDYFARMMPDAEAWFAEHAAEPVTGHPNVVPMDEPFSFARPLPAGDPVNPFSRAALDARKLSVVIEVPDELLMAYGLVPDTRPKPPPTPWRWRLRNRISDWREHAARRAYKVIAGYWPDDGEDDW